MEISKEIKGYDGIFATRFRELLKERNFTQKYVAEQTRSKGQTISQYFNGEVLPNAEKLLEIAKCLAVSADYLLGISDSKFPDINDRKIQELLGLSERTIKILKTETMLSTKYGQVQDNPSYVINLLVEEGHRFDDRRVINILWDIFTHKREVGAEFGIVKFKCSENDVKEIPIYNEPYTLTDDEVFAVRLLQLQKALIQYKNDIDNNVPRVPNFGEDDEE